MNALHIGSTSIALRMAHRTNLVVWKRERERQKKDGKHACKVKEDKVFGMAIISLQEQTLQHFPRTTVKFLS